MKTLWQHIKDLFSNKNKENLKLKIEEKIDTVEVKKIEDKQLETTKNVVQLNIKENVDVVEESKPDSVEIKLEYIKEEKPKRKKSSKKPKVIETNIVPITETPAKRGPKKSKNS